MLHATTQGRQDPSSNSRRGRRAHRRHRRHRFLPPRISPGRLDHQVLCTIADDQGARRFLVAPEPSERCPKLGGVDLTGEENTREDPSLVGVEVAGADQVTSQQVRFRPGIGEGCRSDRPGVLPGRAPPEPDMAETIPAPTCLLAEVPAMAPSPRASRPAPHRSCPQADGGHVRRRRYVSNTHPLRATASARSRTISSRTVANGPDTSTSSGVPR